MSQPSGPSEKLKKLLDAHYGSAPSPILPGIALSAEEQLMMCMDCGKRRMTAAEMREHHCPPGQCHTIGCNDPRHVDPVVPSPPTENARAGADDRQCGFCGCRTNAKARACCDAGRREDVDDNARVREIALSIAKPQSTCWLIALSAARDGYIAGRARGIEEERKRIDAFDPIKRGIGAICACCLRSDKHKDGCLFAIADAIAKETGE